MRNVQGFSTRRTRSGILVSRVHYTADPERNSDWAKSERLKYSSQAAWDREQEIIHEAGGGELPPLLTFVRSVGRSSPPCVAPRTTALASVRGGAVASRGFLVASPRATETRELPRWPRSEG